MIERIFISRHSNYFYVDIFDSCFKPKQLLFESIHQPSFEITNTPRTHVSVKIILATMFLISTFTYYLSYLKKAMSKEKKEKGNKISS